MWSSLKCKPYYGCIGRYCCKSYRSCISYRWSVVYCLSRRETSGSTCIGIRCSGHYNKTNWDQAIVGAVDLASDLRAVKGHLECHDKSVVADGATAFILKRHADALRDGDQIYSVIKGIGVATTQSAQITAIENACSECSVSS